MKRYEQRSAKPRGLVIEAGAERSNNRDGFGFGHDVPHRVGGSHRDDEGRQNVVAWRSFHIAVHDWGRTITVGVFDKDGAFIPICTEAKVPEGGCLSLPVALIEQAQEDWSKVKRN